MIRGVLRLTDAVAVLATAGLFGVVAGGVLTRALFDLSGRTVNLMFQGGIELATTCLCIAVFAGMPRAVAQGLMRVDSMIERLPPGLARMFERLWSAALAGLGAILTWRLVGSAWTQGQRGDTTQDLAIPMWALTGAAAVLVAALTGVALALTAGQSGLTAPQDPARDRGL